MNRTAEYAILPYVLRLFAGSTRLPTEGRGHNFGPPRARQLSTNWQHLAAILNHARGRRLRKHYTRIEAGW